MVFVVWSLLQGTSEHFLEKKNTGYGIFFETRIFVLVVPSFEKEYGL